MNAPPSTASPDHWNAVYRARAADAVSWFRPHLDVSLRLLQAYGMDATSSFIDVGAGASTLVDDLLERGVGKVVLLDISAEAIESVRLRLGAKARLVEWIVGDVTCVSLPAAAFDFWHDRAVLHFLTTSAAIDAYARAATRALRPGGVAIIGGFAPDGPARCSGLGVARRSATDIARCMGLLFALQEERAEMHTTPGGAEQSFVYAVLRRLA